MNKSEQKNESHKTMQNIYEPMVHPRKSSQEMFYKIEISRIRETNE